MGKWLAPERQEAGSLIQTAYEEGVPIFCPAFVDSSAGFGLVKHQKERIAAKKSHMTIDAVDFRELTDIKIAAAPRGSSGRRRRAEELRPGHGGLRRDPRH